MNAKAARAGRPVTLYWNKITKRHGPLLGLKCFNLATHRKLSLPFFAIPNYKVGPILRENDISRYLQRSIIRRVAELEKETRLGFGSEVDPLVLSVRSGDPRSMYGSLLTLPGVGLNDRTYPGLIKSYGPESEREVLWMYLDLIVDFAIHVNGIERSRIQPLLYEMKGEEKTAAELLGLIDKAKNLRKLYRVKFSFPQDVNEQLIQSIKSVAFSWNTLRAECAKAALRLGPEEMLSVFVQQMAYSSLTPDSGFISLLTNPGPYGSFARQTTGRRIMFGLAKNVMDIDELRKEDPAVYAKVMKLAETVVRAEKDPQNLEIVVERGEPKIIQVGKAALSPVVHTEAINDLVAKGVINEAEATRKRAEIQIKRDVVMFKVNPTAQLREIARGAAGSPGAMAGKLALTVEQALEFKKEGERVILVSTEPQDENVYLLTLGHNVDGIISSYGVGRGSHIADFAQANGIPMTTSVRRIRFKKNSVTIGAKRFKVGATIVIDGDKGAVYSRHKGVPIIEDRTVESLSYGVNYLELLRSIRNRYRGKSYEEVLGEHARGVDDLGKQDTRKASKEAMVGIQARIHCLHLLAYEKGKLSGKTKQQVDLDVAVADGNLNRIPGLEDKKFYFKDEGDRYAVITGEEWEDEAANFEVISAGVTDVSKILEAGEEKGLEIEYYRRPFRPSQHSTEMTIIGIHFPKNSLEAVVDFLKEYFKENGEPA